MGSDPSHENSIENGVFLVRGLTPFTDPDYATRAAS